MFNYHETDPPTKLKSAVLGGKKRGGSRLIPPHGPPQKQTVDLQKENEGLIKQNANLAEQLTIALERVVVLEKELRRGK